MKPSKFPKLCICDITCFCCEMNDDEVIPFDEAIHLRAPLPTEEEQCKIVEMQRRIEAHELFPNHIEWASDANQVRRFLIARSYDIDAAYNMMSEALKWRDRRRPADLEKQPDWEEKMGKENETGKVYCPGQDKYGRPVFVFNSGVQNTNSPDDHMLFLAWNLEHVVKYIMPKPEVTDKYLVFIHLESFSLFCMPTLNETKETIAMLNSYYPERLGHCIAYQPPMYFRIFFETVKGFLDPKTVNKLIMVSGDVSEGSENDLLMKKIIGDNWKQLTGVEQPVIKPGCSPGYDHDKYWPQVVQTVKNSISSSGITSDSSQKSVAATEVESVTESDKTAV